MSNYDDGFTRAQREYDNQSPPEDNTSPCPDCNGEGRIQQSNCCDAKMDMDTEICLKCKEHCEDYECGTCNGTGEVVEMSKRELAELKAEYKAECAQDEDPHETYIDRHEALAEKENE